MKLRGSDLRDDLPGALLYLRGQVEERLSPFATSGRALGGDARTRGELRVDPFERQQSNFVA